MEILLVGCGKMGGALKRCWDNHFHVSAISPSNPHLLNGPEDLAANYRPDVIVLAVKPGIMPKIYDAYKPFIHEKCVVASVAAGVTLKSMEEGLGKGTHLCRAMPNIAVEYGFGMTGLSATPSLEPPYRFRIEQLFEPTGKSLWIDESEFDLLAATSGCGPAFIFQFCEHLSAAAQKLGFDERVATLLAEQTLTGAGALQTKSGKTATELRETVTSKGGMTAAGLKAMNEKSLIQDRLEEALQAAIKRAKELG